MNETLRLMCVLAHPDDETFGVGSTIVRYASEGVETYLVVATLGEKGWFGEEEDYPGPATLGGIRKKELLSATRILGVRHTFFLNYIDGELDQAQPSEVIQNISHYIRLVRPQVVITFGPDGNYGHPDHIAISQYTTAAIISAADQNYLDYENIASHRVSKLYYITDTKTLWDAISEIVGEIQMDVNGMVRKPVMWEDWAISARINGEEYWRTTLQAVFCHKSQLPGLGDVHHLTDEQQRRLWAERTYYRAFSLVNGGSEVENDLFAGLRE